MEARNANGSWAGPDAGWTEGDKWAYSFDVVQDVERLIQARGGEAAFVQSLDEHFYGGKTVYLIHKSHVDSRTQATMIIQMRFVTPRVANKNPGCTEKEPIF